MQLLKTQATGNDFLILDGMKYVVPQKAARPQLAKKFCHRFYGFGADGFLVLEKQTDGVHWDFYNSDGSSADMCGNAARAVAQYLMGADPSDSVEFFTSVGKVSATKQTGEEIEVRFPIPHVPVKNLESHAAVLINTGVLHAVVKVGGLQDAEVLRKIGLEIKSQYKQNGINVTFYSPSDKQKMAATTFERGVEDFTLSCGTGALAAARVHLGLRDGTCEVNVPGGRLHVTFEGNQAILRGEARPVGWCAPIEGERT